MSRFVSAVCLASLLAGCGGEKLVDRPPEQPVRDVFHQLKASSIDILFVIDNSDSMREEQEALAGNFVHFMRHIDPDPTRKGEAGEIDYRIAITTTDANRTQGRLIGDPPILQPSTAYDTAAKFQETVAGIRPGGALEEGFTAALLAIDRAKELKDEGGGQAFLRQGAYLYVIIVSDEEDSSFGEVQYYYRRFETLKGVGNENSIAVSAIAGPLPNGCPTAEAGKRYAELAALTGGVLGNICTEDWGATLQELAVTGIGLRKRFQLSRPPRDLDLPEGIGPEDFVEVAVRYPCDLRPEDRLLDERMCQLVEDTCPGNRGSVTCFPWYGDDDAFHFDARENSIVFVGDAVPGPGATIEVRYFPRDK